MYILQFRVKLEPYHPCLKRGADANGIIFQGDEEEKNLALVMSLPFSKEKW